jgi:hypothetical protein
VTNRFSFSGKFDKSGRMTGDATVTVDDGLPEQKNCIKVGKLFGLRIKSIRSKFVNGMANKTTLVEFVDEDFRRAEVVVEGGAPRGLFRVEADDWWSLGTVANGRLDGTCVFNYPSYVCF